MARKKTVEFTAVGLPNVDSYANVAAKLGIDQNNLSAGSAYNFNPISRNRLLIEQAYRGSWIVRSAVDCVADDMTRAGIDLAGDIDPSDIDKIETEMKSAHVWTALNRTIRWARLYGGAIAVILLEGQDLSTPLRVETVGAGQFKGLAVIDRWMMQPYLSELVTDYGPYAGLPKFYDITVTNGPIPPQRVHFSRVVRMDGDDLPFFQKQMENLWGLSVLEPIYDRLVAFDSTTTGAAQLVYKAHLRILKMPGLIKSIAMGAPMMGVTKQRLEMMRLFQSIEGITAIDMEEEFQTNSYSFAGLSDILLQFAQQLSGALGIPMVRLFGQSPAGLNSTGESDLKNYYDMIAASQEADLRDPMTKLLNIVHRSVLGSEPSETFSFDFTSLWQMSEKEKAEVATLTAGAVGQMVEAAVIDHATALKELRQSSDSTGIFTNITDEQIADAENEPPMPSFAEQATSGMGDLPGAGGEPGGAAVAKGANEGNGLRKGNAGPAKADREAERSRNVQDDFDPNEPRDPDGKWTESGGSGKASSSPRGGKPTTMESYKSIQHNNEPTETNREFSDLERKAIKSYSGPQFKTLNDALRQGFDPNAKRDPYEARISPNQAEHIKILDEIISSSSLKQDSILHRWIGADAFSKIDKLTIGETFSDPAFTSTTRIPEPESDHDYLTILAPKGTNAIDIDKHSLHPEAKEILLGRNTKLQIQEKTPTHIICRVVNEQEAIPIIVDLSARRTIRKAL